MARSSVVLALLALGVVAAPGVARAGDAPPAVPAASPAAAPAVASDATAQAAVARFKEDFKAKGLKGEDRRSQRDFALSTLAMVQHPLVVDALAQATTNSDPV